MLETSLLLLKSLNKTEILIFKSVFLFFFFFFFVSKGNLFNVYFTTLQLLLVSCGCGRTSPRTSPWCRLYFILCMGVGGGMDKNI